MFAIYFSSSDGGRAFIAAVDDRHSAVSMAKLLSRQDPRDVMVIENRPVGDTALTARFRRGVLQMDELAEDDLTREPSDDRGDPPPTTRSGTHQGRNFITLSALDHYRAPGCARP